MNGRAPEGIQGVERTDIEVTTTKETPKSCACSGIRSCLICNHPTATPPTKTTTATTTHVCWYCPSCGQLFEGDISSRFCTMNDHSGTWCVLHSENDAPSANINIGGIEVQPEFITETEEEELTAKIDKREWKMSQSGRNKQDFGPQVNFKRKKVKLGSFQGFPSYAEFVVDRLSRKQSVADFRPVELCNLEYTPDRGSAIDPHIDDTWIWGDQLITVNLISNTILTLTKPRSSRSSSAAKDVTPSNTVDIADSKTEEPLEKSIEIQVLMPRRSLVVVSGEARYVWEHGVQREHIGARRLAMTFRNLSREFMEEEKQHDVIKQLFDVCATFKTIL